MSLKAALAEAEGLPENERDLDSVAEALSKGLGQEVKVFKEWLDGVDLAEGVDRRSQTILLDRPMDEKKVDVGKHFANKIWNAARFLLMNMEGRTLKSLEECELNQVDRWILHQLNEAAGVVDRAITGYRFNEAAQAVYEFFWNHNSDSVILSRRRRIWPKNKRFL